MGKKISMGIMKDYPQQFLNQRAIFWGKKKKKSGQERDNKELNHPEKSSYSTCLGKRKVLGTNAFMISHDCHSFISF